ncbi:MAG: CoA-binding protein [Candidatus Dormibacteria bacterium]
MPSTEGDAAQFGAPDQGISWEHTAAYGFLHPGYAHCASLSAALDFWRAQSRPAVCLKGITNQPKSALGLVALNLDSEAALTAAWDRLSARSRELGLGPALLVQEQVRPGVELTLRGSQDSVFGPIVRLGRLELPGESPPRRPVRLAPITKAEANRMTQDVLGTVDSQLAELAMAASQLIADHPEVELLELDPVILTDAGPVVVDLRSSVAAPGTEATSGTGPGPVAGAELAIRRMVSPRSVALIGASTDVSKAGGRVLHYLQERGQTDGVHLVNSRTDQIGDLLTVSTVAGLPADVDVAVVATSAEAVAGILRECADQGIEAAIVFASGFKEAGREALEAEVRQVARSRGIRVCGVNSIGVVGERPLTFSRALDYAAPVAGSVSFVTQSGAMGGGLLVRSWAHLLGTARFFCVGNQTDLTIPDYLQFLAQDPVTRTVGLFVEGLESGRDFARAAQALTATGKGLVVLRTGVTEAGSLAARSHTGILAGRDQLYDQVIAESDAIRVTDLPELIAVCEALDWQPRARGRRLGIVATSGAACSLLADGALELGLEITPWSEATTAALAQLLPDFASVGNPIDTTATVLRDPALLGRTARCVVTSPDVDVILVSLSTILGDSASSVAEDLIRVVSEGSKPLVVTWSLPEVACESAFRLLREAHIPVFDSFALGLLAADALSRAGAAVPVRELSAGPELGVTRAC